MGWFDWLPIFRPRPFGAISAPAKPAANAPSLAVRKSGFAFSGRSATRLATVDRNLQAVVHRALEKSVVDFGVLYGKRSLAEQRGLVEAGASQTLDSEHVKGRAVDVGAYVNGQLNWAGDHYLCIATAFVYAAAELDIGIRWGGAWHIPDIRVCASKDDPGKTMLELYKATRKRQGRKVFLDLGHFELSH